MDIQDQITAKRLQAFQEQVHANAVEKGFWDHKPSFAECIAKIHGELSEALDADMKGDGPDKHCPQFTKREVEMADSMLRELDTCEGHGLNVIGAMFAKHEYNKTRPRLHGKLY